MSNRLAHETSPYLQQHAENPVDWHPWRDEAFALARAKDKPILLSIGYSACHWCHVMAHESFEDPAIAAEMNRLYVNIKVDREERPDVDQIYQTAHQVLTQRAGGWPLTMFLMPDGTPFFGGTYFPKSARYGMPGFGDVLARVAAAYHEKRDEIAKQNETLMETLARSLPQPAGKAEISAAPLKAAVREMAQVFDDVEGGLGQAPKFPHPHEFAFCLRRYAMDGGEIAHTMVRLTLTKMAEGGIYDHLAGGFCRYSVDGSWSIPHFEKMLYDNGPLLALYSDAWAVDPLPRFRQVVEETAAWVVREMQSPQGGYYASLDADSEHEEGKFYVWTREEAQALLSAEEYAVAAAHYGLNDPPNFEGRAWHLRVAQPLSRVAEHLQSPVEACAGQLARARAKLFAAREKRVHPGRDDKILTSWNGLMIRGMARAARRFGEPSWLRSAQKATAFIRDSLWRDGRLLASWKDGTARFNAYLDDHAFMLDALLELMQARFDPGHLEFARQLADLLLEQFEDREHGGFYFVSHDHERLILRPKTGHDGATPSGNGIAAQALQRLGHLIGETRYLEAGQRALELFYPALERQPSGFASLATALEEHLSPPRIALARGPEDRLGAWHARLAAPYRPDALILTIANETSTGVLALDRPDAATPTAWICQGTRCLPPLHDLSAVERALAGA